MLSPVVITRPERQSQELISLLQKQGKTCVSFPMFEIAALDNTTDLDQQLARLQAFTMLVFVSPNAVEAFFSRLKELDYVRPQQLSLAVMGQASRLSLKRHGVDFAVTPVFSPQDKQRTDSETLLKELDLASMSGKEVLVIRGDSGRDFFATSLREAGILVTQVASYQRVIPEFDQHKQSQLLTLISSALAWIVTSSEVLPRLLAWSEKLGGIEMVAKMQQQSLFVPHARIAEKAQELGFKSVSLTASGDENLALALQSRYE
ncbi:uroporphyrinogen-III synthase [Undibacterium sp. LX40W]|uniref:Uroporphyrinogen-III synthase n=1 Tax=Undibacterium nitidum TaxID=2762298 RepID=A0A923HTH5_9BURK|nr:MULTISPECIES: uroporphyrinogen-III synthase [Undibacterium]MBC3883055.1 uroporphyrinogen-III synthase [Undibacterium nitidum]MBC3893336.1 uroporphyrinogen-III synthase [Undibacterium sp. LX40W]